MARKAMTHYTCDLCGLTETKPTSEENHGWQLIEIANGLGGNKGIETRDICRYCCDSLKGLVGKWPKSKAK